jgi:hypothetical protein
MALVDKHGGVVGRVKPLRAIATFDWTQTKIASKKPPKQQTASKAKQEAHDHKKQGVVAVTPPSRHP